MGLLFLTGRWCTIWIFWPFLGTGDSCWCHQPPPPPTHLWAVWAGTNYPPSTEPPPSPGVCAPPPGTSTPGGQPLRKHTLASGTRSEAMGWARGGWEDHLELFSWFLGGRTAELVTCAGWPARFSGALLCEDQAGQYHKDRWMAGRYGAWVYIRDLSVLSYHSATRCRGGYTSSHTEKKHSETRERTNCWEDLQAKIVRRTPFLISIWFMFFVLCSLLLHA